MYVCTCAYVCIQYAYVYDTYIHTGMYVLLTKDFLTSFSLLFLIPLTRSVRFLSNIRSRFPLTLRRAMVITVLKPLGLCYAPAMHSAQRNQNLKSKYWISRLISLNFLFRKCFFLSVTFVYYHFIFYTWVSGYI